MNHKRNIEGMQNAQRQKTASSKLRLNTVIAHIDHGKSTLADRLIQMCGGLSEREMQA